MSDTEFKPRIVVLLVEDDEHVRKMGHTILAKAGYIVLTAGSVRIASLTHRVIAEHVGTSREIVTAQMNRLRRLGMVRYSRRFIDMDCEALEQALLNGGPALPSSSSAFTAVSRS